MAKNSKAKLIFLNIITFGYFNHSVKKKLNNDNQEIKTSEKIPFDVNDLINLLGTKSNIKKLDASINTLQVYFNDKTKINIDGIKKLGAKGTIINNDKISIVFGDFALKLKELIEKEIA